MNADLALRRARAHRLLRAALLWEERRKIEAALAAEITERWLADPASIERRERMRRH